MLLIHLGIFAHLGILFLAAMLAGGMNALAGGGTFFSFPALMALGVPAILSNATNAVCVTPGHALAAIVYKRELSRAVILSKHDAPRVKTLLGAKKS